MTPIWKLLPFLPQSLLSAVKRCTSAKFRLWIRERMGASASSIPDGIRLVSDGRRFHIGPDRVYWAIHVGLDFEPEVTAVLRRLIQSGDTIVDVGANFGWYTTLCGKIAGQTGKVFAFEPVPSTFDRLVENISLNHLEDRVIPVQSAVGQRPGEVTVYVFDQRSHACSSLSPLNEAEHRTVKAEMVSLDDYVCRQHVDQIDFIKCDVEGSELSVFQGCPQLLNGTDAPIIMVELNDETSEAFGYQKQDIWRLLASHGYDSFFAFGQHGTVRRLNSIDEVSSLPLLLCAKADKIERRLGLAAPTKLRSTPNELILQDELAAVSVTR